MLLPRCSAVWTPCCPCDTHISMSDRKMVHSPNPYRSSLLPWMKEFLSESSMEVGSSMEVTFISWHAFSINSAVWLWTLSRYAGPADNAEQNKLKTKSVWLTWTIPPAEFPNKNEYIINHLSDASHMSVSMRNFVFVGSGVGYRKSCQAAHSYIFEREVQVTSRQVFTSPCRKATDFPDW